MANKDYTEADIQSYLDGNFSGDLEDFKSFIDQNPSARKSLELYERLFLQFSLQETYDFPPNLADKVSASIQAKYIAQKIREEKYLHAGLAIIMLIAIVILGRKAGFDFRIFSHYASGFLAVCILTLLVWLFTKIEIEEKRKIYS